MDALTPPLLPGLAVRRPLGQGAHPPWLARADDASWVVARRGPRPLSLPDHPRLLAVYGAVNDAEGESWVLTAYSTGSGLDRRLERVGVVDRAMVARWRTALTDALAALHATGLVHGDVSASRVLLGAGDTVLLDAACARPGGAAAQAADLAALDALLERATGEAAGALAMPPRGRRRAPARKASRAVLVVAATVGLSVGAAGFGVRLAGVREQPALLAVADDVRLLADPSASASVPRPVPTDPTGGPSRTAQPAPDWAAVLAGLDATRGLAFETGEADLLTDVDAPGSEADRRDRALVHSLRARGVTADGWTTTIVSVLPRSVRPAHVVLLVTDIRSAYVLRDTDAAVVARQGASGPATWLVRLVGTRAGWRVASVDVAEASEH